MMRASRCRRLTPASARRAETAASAEPVTEAVASVAPVGDQVSHDETPDVSPRRQHLFGSQFKVRMSFKELMETRGYTGQVVLHGLRRSIAERGDTRRPRDDALRAAGYSPGEVLFPSD